MTSTDAINAVFEGGGALLLCMNVRRLWRDRKLSGVSIVPTIWWNVWGVWNVYFYHAIGAPVSFVAGIAVLVANTIWVALAVWFRWVAS